MRSFNRLGSHGSSGAHDHAQFLRLFISLGCVTYRGLSTLASASLFRSSLAHIRKSTRQWGVVGAGFA
jgi:hypothetical protein